MHPRLAALLATVLLLGACDDLFTDSDEGVEVIGAVTTTRDVPTTLYLGTPHRLTLQVPDDTDPAEVFVARGGGSTAEASLERRSDTRIDVLPGEAGNLILELTDPDGEILGTSRFEVRPVPDPVIQLMGSLGGEIDTGEFRAAAELVPVLGGFPFDAACGVDSFEVTYIAPRQDPVSVLNAGGRFTERTRSVTARAIPGDIYLFNSVRVTCPGDTESREINSMALFVR